MEKFAGTLKNMLEDKLSAYTELKDVLEQEKKYIADMDIDSLWKMTDKKRQTISKIEDIRGRIFCLLEKNNLPVNMDPELFDLSDLINDLGFSSKIKSSLKNIMVRSQIVKEDIRSLAAANKQYTREYLSVINGIFATITGSKNTELYSCSGAVAGDNAPKHLIKAEV